MEVENKMISKDTRLMLSRMDEWKKNLDVAIEQIENFMFKNKMQQWLM